MDGLEQLASSAKSLPFDVSVELGEIRDHLKSFSGILDEIRDLFQKKEYPTHSMSEVSLSLSCYILEIYAL